MAAALLSALKASNLRIAELETDLSKERATKSALIEQLKKFQKQQVADAMTEPHGPVKRMKTDDASPSVKEESSQSASSEDDIEASPSVKEESSQLATSVDVIEASPSVKEESSQSASSVDVIEDIICSPPSPEKPDEETSTAIAPKTKKKRGRPCKPVPAGACYKCIRGYGAHATTCVESRFYRPSLP